MKFKKILRVVLVLIVVVFVGYFVFVGKLLV